MDLDGQSPEDIAEQVFTQPPQPEKTVQLYCESAIKDGKIDAIDIFEIFLTMLMEGILIRYSPVTAETLKYFNEESLDKLRPWLRSMGFDIKVETYPVKCDDSVKKEFNKQYCKAILKCDPSWNAWFEMKNIEKNYHFILGNKSPIIKGKKGTMDNLYCIFINNNITYKIAFKFI